MKSGFVLFLATAVLLGFAAYLGAQASGAASIWDGVYTAEQAERGAQLYMKGCAECHGNGLEGDDMSPPLIGDDFLWDWNGLTLGDMFERIKISMPDGKPRTMSDQEKADVLAYMLRENEMPTGENEIEARVSTLKPIQFLAAAP